MADRGNYEPLYPGDAARTQSRRQRTDFSALNRLFDEWMQGDGQEQRETFEVLRRSLDEDRPDGYKLFP